MTTTTPGSIQAMILAYTGGSLSDEAGAECLDAIAAHARHRLAEETDDMDSRSASRQPRSNIHGHTYYDGAEMIVWSAESATGWMMTTDATTPAGARYQPGREGRVSR